MIAWSEWRRRLNGLSRTEWVLNKKIKVDNDSNTRLGLDHAPIVAKHNHNYEKE